MATSAVTFGSLSGIPSECSDHFAYPSYYLYTSPSLPDHYPDITSFSVPRSPLVTCQQYLKICPCTIDSCLKHHSLIFLSIHDTLIHFVSRTSQVHQLSAAVMLFTFSIMSAPNGAATMRVARTLASITVSSEGQPDWTDTTRSPAAPLPPTLPRNTLKYPY